MTERRKAVAHYAAQEDAARDYADARRLSWLEANWSRRPQHLHVGHGLFEWWSNGAKQENLRAAIDAAMELERAGRTDASSR